MLTSGRKTFCQKFVLFGYFREYMHMLLIRRMIETIPATETDVMKAQDIVQSNDTMNSEIVSRPRQCAL